MRLKLAFWLWLITSIFAPVGPLAAGVPWYQNVPLKSLGHLISVSTAPPESLKKALAYFELYRDRIPNKNYIAIFKVTQRSSEKRLFLVNLLTGVTDSYLVAHGRGSDKDHDGFADRFSNQLGSEATSLGFYLTGATYMGDNGYSLRLKGIEASNSNAERRAIVIHGADYVNQQIARTENKIGRSQGCPAVELGHTRKIINQLKNGAVLLIE